MMISTVKNGSHYTLDVLTTYAPTTERNIDHELLSASLILLYMYLITYTLLYRLYHFNKKHYH